MVLPDTTRDLMNASCRGSSTDLSNWWQAEGEVGIIPRRLMGWPTSCLASQQQLHSRNGLSTDPWPPRSGRHQGQGHHQHAVECPQGLRRRRVAAQDDVRAWRAGGQRQLCRARRYRSTSRHMWGSGAGEGGKARPATPRSRGSGMGTGHGSVESAGRGAFTEISIVRECPHRMTLRSSRGVVATRFQG